MALKVFISCYERESLKGEIILEDYLPEDVLSSLFSKEARRIGREIDCEYRLTHAESDSVQIAAMYIVDSLAGRQVSKKGIVRLLVGNRMDKWIARRYVLNRKIRSVYFFLTCTAEKEKRFSEQETISYEDIRFQSDRIVSTLNQLGISSSEEWYQSRVNADILSKLGIRTELSGIFNESEMRQAEDITNAIYREGGLMLRDIYSAIYPKDQSKKDFIPNAKKIKRVLTELDKRGVITVDGSNIENRYLRNPYQRIL